ncbi:3-oxoacyl-[acyl-carrier-protein] reductase [Candidatus Bipolaricaulota bacterium]|nr:3-oxoacyl-[acyl-carrier-protein] reductase [Candidatus Bipolaricaulota bacterium]
MGEFGNRVAVVTGGARGIGKAIVRLLHQNGCAVTVLDSDKQTGKVLEKEFDGCRFLAADISDFAQVQKAVRAVYEKNGRLDFLVNNAGITGDGLIVRMREEDWDRVLAVNLKGAYNCIHACLRYMLKCENAAIVSISSVVGETGNAGQANYAASKAGLIGLSRSVAKEVGGRGIRVNVVAPGFIHTEMTDDLSDEIRASYLARLPMKREGTVEEIAAVVSFLLSERSSYITGQVIGVNGGLYP